MNPRMRMGQYLGLDPCDGCVDGSEPLKSVVLLVAFGLSWFVVYYCDCF